MNLDGVLDIFLKNLTLLELSMWNRSACVEWKLDSQHVPSRSIVCPLKLGCLGVLEDSVAVARIAGPWFFHCFYLLDL